MFICCSAIFAACDGHVLALQMVAWSKMAYSFAQKDSVQVAVEKTFDGNHRCKLCERILQLRAQDQSIKTMFSDYQIKDWLEIQAILPVIAPSVARRFVIFTLCAFESRTLSPPLPPPRAIA